MYFTKNAFFFSFQWWSTIVKKWVLRAKRVSDYKRTLTAVGVRQHQSAKSPVNVTKLAGSTVYKHAHKCDAFQRECNTMIYIV